jgi:hypothetical protein
MVMQSFADAANDLRRQITEKVTDIKSSPEMTAILQLVPLLNGLEALLGQPPTSLGALFALGESSAAGAIVQTAALRPDEFVHLPALEAAKRYLKKAGQPARPFKEIVEAIKTHGGEVGREDRLKIQLIRSTADIKKVGDDLFGLLEWYPSRRGRPVGSGGARGTEVDAADESSSDASEHEKAIEEENAPPEGEAS